MQATTKTLDEHFRDWEHDAFGFGYGTGEEFILPALRTFMECVEPGPDGGGYHHDVLEQKLGGATAWLLINALLKVDALNYGTSPRFGFLNPWNGYKLRDYILSKTADELVAIVTDYDQEYRFCEPVIYGDDGCACIADDVKRQCPNPFWYRGAGSRYPASDPK